MKTWKQKTLATTLFASMFASAAIAQSSTSAGIVLNTFSDPSDLVLQLNNAGPCGSSYFHVKRDNLNFREMVAVSLTAFTTGKTLTLFVERCESDRNVVSHGYVSR